MMAGWRDWADRLLGRGDAATTIPIFDGSLKPNQWLEEAEVVAEFETPEDLATDGRTVWVADGPRVLRFDGAAPPVEAHRFDRPVTALACLAGGAIAVALDGRRVQIVGGAHDGRSWDAADGKAFVSVNAICSQGDRLFLTEGSAVHPQDRWVHDLMGLGRSGRLVRLDASDGSASTLRSGLGFAFGVAAAESGEAGASDRPHLRRALGPAGPSRSAGSPHAAREPRSTPNPLPRAGEGARTHEIWVSESWRHRVVRGDGAGSVVLDRLPGYPGRLSPASGGGFWLSVFAGRTQLVEFVLREPAFRKRMLAELDPKHWIAPALSSGHSFLEPLQGAGVRQMGVLKPWAPPRSYGLVIRLSAEGLPLYSLHSRVGGVNHGVVSAVEANGQLYVLAKGARRVLRLNVAEVEKALLG